MKASCKRLLECGWRVSHLGNQQKTAPRFLEKQFTFSSFNDAFSFIASIAMLAERRDHHPDWSNSYTSVTIKWNTHRENGGDITETDWEMAEATQTIYYKYAAK
ncbi:hypothetical protein MDAP_002590 [Mitosporidium daphniae]